MHQESQQEGENEEQDEDLHHQKMAWEEGLQLIMQEHQEFHWGPYKVYHELKKQGVGAPFKIVKDVCDLCEACARFRVQDAQEKMWSNHPFLLFRGILSTRMLWGL